MTIKQAEYLARTSVDVREYGKGSKAEIEARTQRYQKEEISEDKMSDLIGVWPDFPRNDE